MITVQRYPTPCPCGISVCFFELAAEVSVGLPGAGAQRVYPEATPAMV
jgi:hypothetical protein